MANQDAVKMEAEGKGFGELCCPLCGGEHVIMVSLAYLDTGECFHCAACEGDFGVSDVQAMLDEWSRVLGWLNTMPCDQ